MTADNDIVNIVDGKFSGRSFIHLPRGDWADLRAEIVRLRGEVGSMRQCGVKYLGWLGVKNAEKALRKDMADPDMVERHAPAMPNGVEGLVQNFLDKEVHPTVRDWENRNLAGISILKHWRDFLISLTHAADNRDAAGVVPAWIATWMADREILPDDDGDGISEGALVEALNNHERELLNAIPKAPAAVPAGEAVAVCGTCNGVGMIGGHRGQTPDSFEQWAEDCPDCTPQPADGEAVAEWQVWHKEDGWGATHPDNVAEYRARGVPVRPLYAHPPAPVQAAPQEGGDSHAFKNFHRSLCARFGYTHDENDWRRDLVSLEEHIARMAARPSACELGAVRELVKVWRIAVNSASTTNKQDLRPEHFIRELEAALQHRGDSRGGEGS